MYLNSGDARLVLSPALVEVEAAHRPADPEPLAAMLKACEEAE